jgi:hypothetical protein
MGHLAVKNKQSNSANRRYYNDGYITMKALETLWGQRLSWMARIVILENQVKDLSVMAEAQAKFIKEMSYADRR